MTTSQAEWMETLTRQQRSAIRELHHINPWWNLVALLFVVLWIGTGIALMSYPVWYVRLPGYLFIGVLIHGLGNFMHEAIHGNLFRSRQLDRWVGFLCGLPTLFQITGYGVSHLLHHKHTRTEHDPDSMMNFSSNRIMQSIIFYTSAIVGVFLYHMRLPLVVFTRGTKKDRGKLAVETIITVASVGLLLFFAFRFQFLDVVVHCWLIPLLAAALIANIRGGWAEHELTEPGHPLTQTRTVTSTRLYSFFNINLNYHLEHHLFPSIPWYNLPKLHRLLLPEYRAAGAPIYSSYWAFVWDAFKMGIHGRAPDSAGHSQTSAR